MSPTLAVVAHDAGGAEIVSSYIRRAGSSPLLVLAGPAVNIFERKLGRRDHVALTEAVEACDSMLCGTSWQSSLEWNAIKLARQHGKRSVAFLDHWQNYRERFVRDGELCLPDELWVGDIDAERMAVGLFPDVPVVRVDNPYLQDIKDELAQLRPGTPQDPRTLRVLYVAEPLREHGRLHFADERHWGYVEEDALRYFLENVGALGKPVSRIVIRPHPSEPPGKYAWAEREFGLPIASGGGRPLLQEVADADVVVGCQSMALVVALSAGKRVVSCIPPGGQPSVLPQRDIEKLQVLVQTRRTSE